jgi:putative chitinase
MATRDDWGIDAACWEFAINKGLVPIANKGDFKLVTTRINGGLIGYKDRLKYYERCKKYIV